MTPPIYQKMRRLGGSSRHTRNAVADIINVQAQLMEHWRDDFAWDGFCEQPPPTIGDLMQKRQLRREVQDLPKHPPHRRNPRLLFHKSRAVWSYFCASRNRPQDEKVFAPIRQYEKDVLLPRRLAMEEYPAVHPQA